MDAIDVSRLSTRIRLASGVGFATLLVALVSLATTARGQEPTPASAAAGGTSGQSDLAEINAKLSNPVSNVWALFTEFDLNFSNGDVNRGNPQVGGDMLLQPILPFPLFGSGDNAWKLVTRPVIPIHFSAPVAAGGSPGPEEGGSLPQSHGSERV